MLKDIYNNYKKQARHIAIGYILTSIMVILFLSFTIIIVEFAIPKQDIQLIVFLSVLYFIVNILRAIATFYEDLNNKSFVKELEADYREKIYMKIQNLQESEMDKLKIGNILENILNDTKEIARFYSEGIMQTYCGGVVRLLGTILILMYLNIPIMFIVLCIYIIGFSITHLFNKRSLEYTTLKRTMNAKILNWSNDQVYGFSTIKTLLVEEERLKELSSLIKEYNIVTEKLEKNIRIYTCLYEFIISFIMVFCMCYGSIGVVEGFVVYGSLTILVRYVSSPEAYAEWIISGFQIRNLGRISYCRVLDLLKREEENIEIGKPLDCVETLEYKQVNFSYDSKNPILTDINITACKDDKIALVGKTGCGKTSLVNLICRFYHPNDGEILINGENYHNFNITSLRSKIGYIMQDVVIIDGTIEENINYANLDVRLEDIVEICKKFRIHDRIMKLKDGYNTMISSDTDLLSTGEKQLLNFARVMISNPEIIILDEATASLSYKSEMLVRNAIEEVTKNRISFIIAHRLSTIRDCSQILYLDHGQIIERGTHNELLERKGYYYDLLNDDHKTINI